MEIWYRKFYNSHNEDMYFMKTHNLYNFKKLYHIHELIQYGLQETAYIKKWS